MKSATKNCLVISLLALLALGLVVPAFAQDQLNITDGVLDSLFSGGSDTRNPQLINLTLPSDELQRQPAHLLHGKRRCQRHRAAFRRLKPKLHSFVSAAIVPATGSWAGPFYLTLQPDGHSNSYPDGADQAQLHLAARHADRLAQFFHGISIVYDKPRLFSRPGRYVYRNRRLVCTIFPWW